MGSVYYVTLICLLFACIGIYIIFCMYVLFLWIYISLSKPVYISLRFSKSSCPYICFIVYLRPTKRETRTMILR